MFKLGLGDTSFLNNIISKNPIADTNIAFQELNLGKVSTSKLSNLLESEPMLAYLIMDKLGWKIDHTARSQILQIIKDIHRESPPSKGEVEAITISNAAIIAHNHERFKISFKDDPQIINLFPFSKKRNIEILAYSIDQYCDLSSYEDYEVGFKLVSSVASADYRMRNQRDMLLNEGYDVDITSISIEDIDTKIQYYHTWLFNNYRNGHMIIHKVNINNLIKTHKD